MNSLSRSSSVIIEFDRAAVPPTSLSETLLQGDESVSASPMKKEKKKALPVRGVVVLLRQRECVRV
jgi:hypothetical protein